MTIQVNPETRLDDLAMIRSAFLLMSGAPLDQELIMQYSPLTFEIQAGSLSLQLDMPTMFDEEELKFEELNIGSSDNEEEPISVGV